MKDEFDILVDKLQDKIFEEAKDVYGIKGFERWRNQFYRGRLENPDVHARITGKCEDTIEIFLIFQEDRVIEASYITDGCASSQICGSFIAELSIGKNPDELSDITGETILEKIGKFPKKDEHCAFLAAETLQEALKKYMIRQTKKCEIKERL